MKIFNSRLVALTTAALLVLSACGGETTSSRTRNTVLAGGPCVAASQLVGTTVEVSFCAGAVKYSIDNGETLIGVPQGAMKIAGNMWPETEGMVFKFSILSYDQAGTLIGDDVVTRTVKDGCEFGNYCNNGETGPNGGTVVLSKTAPLYYEIMPTAEGFATSQRITAKEAAAANIDAPWQLPPVVALSDILNSTVGESISDSRLNNFRFEAGVSQVCDEMKQEKYCLFHPYWTKDSDTRFAPSTLPSDNDTGKEQIKTIGYDLWDYQGNDSIKQFCPLSDTSRSAGCLATLLPVHVYTPKKPSNTIAVEQVDRDRWQDLCTGAPEIAIGDNEPNQDFSITVSHPCMQTASKEKPVSLIFKVLRLGTDDDAEVVSDLANEVSDPNTQINIEAPANGGKVFNYNLPEGNYMVKSRVFFPRVGTLDMSEPAYADFTVGATSFMCNSEDLILKENQLTTTCEGATGLSLSYVYGVDTEPRFGKPSESVVLEMPDGWHMFEVTIFGKTSQFGLQMWGCLKDCEPTVVNDLTVTAVGEDMASVSTSRLECEAGRVTLFGQDHPNGNKNLLSFVGPIETITVADQIIAKPDSGFYMYQFMQCVPDETQRVEFGLVSTEKMKSNAASPELSKDVIARTQVMDIDRNDGNPVIAPATNTIMEIVMSDMKDVASMSISMNGSTTNLSAGAQPTLVNIPTDATSMKITTTKKNGAVEVYTKAISRPAQLPTAASAATSAPSSEGTSRNIFPWLLILLLIALLVIIARIKYRKPKESL